MILHLSVSLQCHSSHLHCVCDLLALWWLVPDARASINQNCITFKIYKFRFLLVCACRRPTLKIHTTSQRSIAASSAPTHTLLFSSLSTPPPAHSFPAHAAAAGHRRSPSPWATSHNGTNFPSRPNVSSYPLRSAYVFCCTSFHISTHLLSVLVRHLTIEPPQFSPLRCAQRRRRA